jgi:hypothetical protein
MLRGLKGTGKIVLFLLAGFLFLTTLKESCGQIEVLPGAPASPVDDENATKGDENTTKSKDLLDQEMKGLDLVLSGPLIFFVLPTFGEEGYRFDLTK